MINYIEFPMMNNQYAVQLIVVLASILLGMILYPVLLKKWRQFVNWLYRITYGNSGQKSDKLDKMDLKTNNSHSVIGESKFRVGHSRTKASTSLENEDRKENAPIFAPQSEDGNPEIKDAYVPLVKEKKEDPVDLQDESLFLNTESGAVLASGASYDELVSTGKIIVKDKPTDDEKAVAGQVLYENRQTEMLEQVVANSEETAKTIAALIEAHLAIRAQGLRQDNDIVFADDFKNFDINSIF